MKQLSLYFFLLASTLYGQQETANWYFGRNAGIRFNAINGTVSAVTDGRLRTLEGCSAISDRGGNLLFYTDGVIFRATFRVPSRQSLSLNQTTSTFTMSLQLMSLTTST